MDVKQAKTRLEDEKSRIMNRLENTDEYGLGEQMNEELSELSMYDNHPADIATELFERGKDIGLKVGDKARIDDINAALAAIDEGNYGTCQKCGQTIDEDRLEAFPSSVLCITCKRGEEAEHPALERPIEEAVLYPGFGQYDFDRADQTEFDSEDSWQAVGRFNERPNIDGQMPMDDDTGIVDLTDAISNEYYQEQLPPPPDYYP